MYSENGRTKQQMPHFYQFYEDFKLHEERFTIQHDTQNLMKPYLIIQGTQDEAVKEKKADLLHKWCKTSELFMIENANHTFGAKEPWTSDEIPADLAKAVEKSVEFLQFHFRKINSQF